MKTDRLHGRRKRSIEALPRAKAQLKPVRSAAEERFE